MTGKQMKEYHQIKDDCRKVLLGHLEKALINIPKTGNPRILDVGCGTGVPTLWLAENFPGKVSAIDNDHGAIGFLKEKIQQANLENRVEAQCISFFDFNPGPGSYDIILAEGFLNVVGFETGFQRLIRMLGSEGYFIIHDEYKEHRQKCDFIRKNQCRIIDTLFLDKNVWWNDYYRQLDAAIQNVQNKNLLKILVNDIQEIEYFKKDPSSFQSMYYVLQKS